MTITYLTKRTDHDPLCKCPNPGCGRRGAFSTLFQQIKGKFNKYRCTACKAEVNA